ncbi:MAG TPA: DNA-3-methyladenine glycosylase [Patescibacteria group bacterium]|nr:DNA-3-methyladenine glycosylase [Patescibacteria group bacterium]
MYTLALDHFEKNDPILFEVSKNTEPFELEIHPYPFIRLLRSIVGQQLSVKAASTIFGRFENLFENKNITPTGLLKITDDNLRSAGISYQKISYLKDFANKIVDGEVVLEKFALLENEEVIVELTKIKGVGRWTAEMYLMSTLARPDIFSYGDLGLQNAIKKHYGMKNKPTIKQMEKLSKKWSPFRTYAARILWKSLENNPI